MSLKEAHDENNNNKQRQGAKRKKKKNTSRFSLELAPFSFICSFSSFSYFVGRGEKCIKQGNTAKKIKDLIRRSWCYCLYLIRILYCNCLINLYYNNMHQGTGLFAEDLICYPRSSTWFFLPNRCVWVVECRNSSS